MIREKLLFIKVFQLPTVERVAIIGMKANRQIKKFISKTGYFWTKYNLIIESNNTNIVYPEKPNTKPKKLFFSKPYCTIISTTTHEECWVLT